MNDDAALLRRYAEEGSEAAFTELVRRHVELVYSAALRRTGGDAHRAADVAQKVFTALARDARRLARHAVLGAWLHTATRNAALNLMISEQRRRAREQAAVALEPPLAAAEASPDWERLRPVLDAAIDELPEPDRAAVVLRFLERRAFAEIGAALHVSEDAARMRTERALDKLRAALARRGITSTAAALGAIVANQPAVALPAGLSAGVAAQALAAAAAAPVGTAALLTLFMSTKTIIAALGAIAAFAAGAYFGLSRNLETPLAPPPEAPRHAQLIAALRKDNQSLKAEVDRLNADVGRLNAANKQRSASRPAPAEAAPATLDALRVSSQQKAILNNLRQMAAARDQFELENGRPPSSIDELVGDTKYVKRVNPVDGENYAGMSLLRGQPMIVTTANGMTVTYDPTGGTTTKPQLTPAEARAEELSRRINSAVNQAMAAYRAAHEGKNPPTPEALLSYFATPQEGADFVEALEAQKAARGR